MAMPRYNRSQFVAFGVLNFVNAIAWLLYKLGLTTRGAGGASDELPVLLIAAAVCSLAAVIALVRRGYHLGRPAWQTVLGFWLSLCLGPVALMHIGYFAFAHGDTEENQYGPRPTRTMATTLVWAILVLVCPWLVVAIASLLFE